MLPLSATAAISPAFSRLQLVLAKPFRLGKSWKLAATCYLAIMGDPGMLWMILFLASFVMLNPMPRRIIAGGIAAVLFAIMFFLFWIGSRLEFAAFEIAAAREQFVAPAWRRSASVVWRWIGLKILFVLSMAVIIGPPLFLLWTRLLRPRFTEMLHGQPSAASIVRFFAVIIMINLFLGLGMIVSGVLNDFFVPVFALEATSIREVCRRFRLLFSSEPGQFFAYLGLKVALAIGGFIAIYIASMVFLIPFQILVFGGFGLVGSITHNPLAALGVIIPLMICMELCLMYFTLGAYGALNLLLRCYAVYFLGGRYPLLGELLDSTTPPPPPPFPEYVLPTSLPPEAPPVV